MKPGSMKKEDSLSKEYDFSKGIKNPYIKNLKKPITIRIEEDTIEYFKKLAQQYNIPYQSLMNLFLSDCAKKEVKPSINWKKAIKS
jgi:predicted DNA binding CopG/RHH family protein